MPLDQHALFGQPRFALRVLRRIMRATPSKPRCKVCYAPFHGVGGRVVRFAGFAPSRKNPNLCNACFEKAPLGGHETEIGVLFADVRGFTTMSEGAPAEEMAALLNRFYATATDVLIERDGIIDKLVGDQVMALFIPYFTSGDYIDAMVDAAIRLLEAVGYVPGSTPWCRLGIGLHAGDAFVGNVGSGEIKDFTAIGDVVNTASRLQGQAAAGEILLSQRVYDGASNRCTGARARDLELRGKAEVVRAFSLDLSSAEPANA